MSKFCPQFFLNIIVLVPDLMIGFGELKKTPDSRNTTYNLIIIQLLIINNHVRNDYVNIHICNGCNKNISI